MKYQINEFRRNPEMEDTRVKYAVMTTDQLVTATMIYSNHFPDEMEVRIVQNNERFSVVGHKSIMDNFSFESFKLIVLQKIIQHEEFKNES